MRSQHCCAMPSSALCSAICSCSCATCRHQTCAQSARVLGCKHGTHTMSFCHSLLTGHTASLTAQSICHAKQCAANGKQQRSAEAGRTAMFKTCLGICCTEVLDSRGELVLHCILAPMRAITSFCSRPIMRFTSTIHACRNNTSRVRVNQHAHACSGMLLLTPSGMCPHLPKGGYHAPRYSQTTVLKYHCSLRNENMQQLRLTDKIADGQYRVLINPMLHVLPGKGASHTANTLAVNKQMTKFRIPPVPRLGGAAS